MKWFYFNIGKNLICIYIHIYIYIYIYVCIYIYICIYKNILFDRSKNLGAIDVKMNGSFLNEKLSLLRF